MLRHIRWEGPPEEEDEGGVNRQRTAIVPRHSDGTALQLTHVSMSMERGGGSSLLLKEEISRNKKKFLFKPRVPEPQTEIQATASQTMNGEPCIQLISTMFLGMQQGRCPCTLPSRHI